MAVIKVPESVAVSPQDSSPLKYLTIHRQFVDEHKNAWTADELSAARPANKVKRWIAENYPERF